MIRVNSLTVKYKKITAIDSVSFYVNKGDIVALAGQNGAGKSTLLKSLIGLLPATNGSVLVEGSIGWMPEGAEPDPSLKVSEYILFSSYLKKTVCVDSMLHQCGLDKYRDTLCKDLSKGVKQRLLLASALVGDPEILILDEPSAGLDPLFQAEMIHLIKHISEGITVILSTHNISEINSLADRIIVLKDGAISYQGLTKEEEYYEYF